MIIFSKSKQDFLSVLDGLDPRWEVDNGGLLIAVDQLVNGGNKLPDVAEEKDPLSIDGPDLILECNSYKSETIVKRNFDQNDASNSSQQEIKTKRMRKQNFSILREISLKTKGVPEMSNNAHVCEIPTTATEQIHADILKQLSGPPKDIQDVFIGYYNKQLQPSDPNGFLQTLSDAPWKTSIRAILWSSDCFRLQKNSCRWTISSRLCSLCRCTKYCK